MSRKRKITNRRSPAKPRSPLDSIKTELASPMTLKACALKATGEDLRLIMSQVLISQTHMVTYIKNSGIAEEIKPKLFTPNFTTKTTGTGLGLAMVKNSVTSFNGTITFETEINKGTTFILEFPALS